MTPRPRAKLGREAETPTRWETPLLRRLSVAILVLVCAGLNVFAPLDRALLDARFTLSRRPPSGQIVVVAIDSPSLQSIGLWPWPRLLEARLLDRLREMGARRTVFDIDFSSESDPENDALFTDSLKQSAGAVELASFAQSDASGRVSVTRPIARFREFAAVAQADVPSDSDGGVRDYWSEVSFGGSHSPTIGVELARRRPEGRDIFGIDYSIDIEAIDRISASAVIAGDIDPQRIRGKDVIVGATAEELRDSLRTPRFGSLPGALVHAEAAETLVEDRAMRDVPGYVLVALIMLLAIGPSLLPRRAPALTVPLAAVALAVAIEAAAFWIQYTWALRFGSGTLLAGLALMSLAGLVADLGIRRRQYAQAAREREFLRTILERVVADHFDGVVVVDPGGVIVAASGAARDLLGADLEGRPAFAALPDEFAGPLARAISRGANILEAPEPPQETTLVRADGEMRHIEFVITLSAVDPAGSRLVACLTFRELTERRARQERLIYLARHDELTGAWSGGQLFDGLRDWIEKSQPAHRTLALFSLNLRRFSTINDLFGRHVGDKLLRMVADRLAASGLTMVTRLGSDNYAFAHLGALNETTLAALGAGIVARICEPYTIGDAHIVVGASLGATTTAISGLNPDDLLSHANLAQAVARRRGGDAFATFSPIMETTQREKQRIDAALRGAIGDGTLELHYQPKIELASGRIVGAEALMRWRTPDGDSISPARFIPIAEESGLIVELGRWALAQACLECKRWEGSATVAVNVSPVQFALSDVFSDVRRALEAARLAPARLEIEITESVFVHHESGVEQTLERLRALGVAVAIDDFGTGYSSLQYLGRLPFDTIKIDQGFIRELDKDSRAGETVRAIASLARTHGKRLVAEGVETEAQAIWLASIGCDYVQGYYYARSRDGATLRSELAIQAA